VNVHLLQVLAKDHSYGARILYDKSAHKAPSNLDFQRLKRHSGSVVILL
jgi:hypothetical protein